MSDVLKTIPIHGKEYVEVKTRVQYFRKHYENGSIDTEHVFFDGEQIMCKTKVHVNGELVSTGMAHEIKDVSHINKTSFVEVCETSSVGRALGILGIGIESSVDTYNTIYAAKKQQETTERTDSLLNYKAEQLGIQLFNAISEDDEDAIKSVVSDMRGDQDLADKVKAGLTVEHAEYMDERKARITEERKVKSAEKHKRAIDAAKTFAEKETVDFDTPIKF